MGTWIRRHKTKYVFNHEVESMDHILEGVLASNHPEQFKRDLISKIAEKGQQEHPPRDIGGVFQLSTNWVLQGTTELQVSSGFKLLNSWGNSNVNAFVAFFTRDLLVNILTKPCRNQANVPLLLCQALEILEHSEFNKIYLQHLKIIEAKAPTFIQENSDISCVNNFLKLLLQFQDGLPKADLASRLSAPLLHILAVNQIPQDQNKVCQFINDVSSVADFLHHLWSRADTPTSVLLDCLKELFNTISTVEPGQEPSVCLAAIVKYIPVEVILNAVKSAVADNSINDAAVNAALRRMIDWLVWPTCKNIDQWIIGFLRELGAAKKFSILISVTDSKVEQILEKMIYPPVREASFNILSHMLLGFQHSPGPFHKMLQQVPEILNTLSNERTEAADHWRSRLANLLYCLMFLHTGFPDLYDSILDLIKNVPSPDNDEIQSKLAEYRWSGLQCVEQVETTAVVGEKSETGKTGFFNLGNTCYMSCILQTLFMSDDFRLAVLNYRTKLQEDLLEKLQHVFAYLLLSQRPAIAPLKFLVASRPPWFIPGQQQDCSEFLKFLLDQIHEQQLEAMKKESALSIGTGSSNSEESSSVADCSSDDEIEVGCGSISKKSLSKRFSLRFLTGRSSRDTSNRSSESSVEKSEMAVTAVESNGGNNAAVNQSEHSKDNISQAEVSDNTIVKEAFGGKVRTTFRCLACQQESHRVENFIDIPLAFPEQGSHSSPPLSMSPKSLAGGGLQAVHGRSVSEPMDQGDEPGDKENIRDIVSDKRGDDEEGGSLHLNELLGHYLNTERLEGDNQYHCEKCGRLQDGERTIAIIESPKYLILTLLRFAYDTRLHTRSKVFREVSYPRTLALPVNLGHTDHGSDPMQTSKRRKKLLNHLNSHLPPNMSPLPETCDLYGLCSVVIHSGASSECGHYYCYARHCQAEDVDSVIKRLPKGSEDMGVKGRTYLNGDSQESEVDFLQDTWYLFNDSRVSYASYSSFSKVSHRFKKDTPYVLVYKKMNLDPHQSELPAEPQIRQELRDSIVEDNAKYLQEQEVAARIHSARSRSASTSSATLSNWQDPDSDQGPSGNCGGGGGLGGLDTTGSRFVF